MSKHWFPFSVAMQYVEHIYSDFGPNYIKSYCAQRIIHTTGSRKLIFSFLYAKEVKREAASNQPMRYLSSIGIFIKLSSLFQHQIILNMYTIRHSLHQYCRRKLVNEVLLLNRYRRATSHEITPCGMRHSPPGETYTKLSTYFT